MIKFVVAALWLVAVTLGTVIFSFSMSGPKAKAPRQHAHAEEDDAEEQGANHHRGGVAESAILG